MIHCSLPLVVVAFIALVIIISIGSTFISYPSRMASLAPIPFLPDV